MSSRLKTNTWETFSMQHSLQQDIIEAGTKQD